MKMKTNAKKMRRKKRIWGAVAATFLILAVLILGAGAYLQSSFLRELPDDFFRMRVVGKSPKFYVYDFEDRTSRKGEVREVGVGMFAQKETIYLSYGELPQALIDAFVAIEDKRFYQHKGVDWYRTAAAVGNYVLGYSNRFGASTITQQVVKNMTGDSEISMRRKLQEIFYALDLERNLDKSEIMELYLNIIHFSDNCNGVGEAASHYFSKSVSELTVAECATIAAITNSPSYYNPIRHPANNLERRNLILSQMHAQGYLTDAEYQHAKESPLALHVRDGEEEDGINSWYVDMVIEDVIQDLMKTYHLTRGTASQFVLSGGISVDMAMDEELQRIAEEYYRTALQLPVNENGVKAESALIMLDNRTGDVLAIVGSAGEKRGNRLQNFATQTLRPPGSAIKPLSVFAPALEEGLINWASVYDDVPCNFGQDGRSPWPKNATGVYRGLTDVSYAVAHSTNTVAVKILEELGKERSFSWARDRFHLQSLRKDGGANDCDTAALALGQLHYGVTLRELSAAYTVFADAGVYHPWRSYFRVLDSEGRVLLSNPDKGEVVLSAGNAAIMTKLLQGVVANGTSSAITLDKTVECAGKTGTTHADGDRWYIGYTPDMICGVWCGYEYPEPLQGRNVCVDIWNRVMRAAVAQKGGRTTFAVPREVTRLSYCRDSGKLATDICGKDARGNRIAEGWFLSDHEPHSSCDCHILCGYDKESQGIDHGFCPRECVEEVALIRVERRFPIPIRVSDAQYVYKGDPTALPPNPDPTQGYFQAEAGEYIGNTGTKHPFHRSCPTHQAPPPEPDWEYLLPEWERQA